MTRERTQNKSIRITKLRAEILADVLSYHKEWKGNKEVENNWSIYRLICNAHPIYRPDYAKTALELGVIRAYEHAELIYVKK